MEKDGTGMEEVLKKAQELGYAERDPSADIEGYDTARKIAILASIMTGRKVSYEDVPTQGITGISLEDIKKAASCGRRIKLIGRAELKEDGSLNISVSPEEVGEDSMFFGVDGAYNAVITESRDTGKLMFFGSGAGRYPTAAAIIADILHTQDPVSGKLLWE